MKPDEFFNEMIESFNAGQDVREINGVICQNPNSMFFNRFQALQIMHKHLDGDADVRLAYALLSNMPVEQLTNVQLWQWLNTIKGYVMIKRTKELSEKGNTNANA